MPNLRAHAKRVRLADWTHAPRRRRDAAERIQERVSAARVISPVLNRRAHSIDGPSRHAHGNPHTKEQDPMSDVKKDHSIGAGTGAVAGAVTGAAVGSAAGPVGTVVGGVVGGVVGAKAGDSIAEAVNPTEYSEHFKNTYRERPYFSKEREWSDYEPAYKYGYDTYGQYRGQRFDDVETDLERNWQQARAKSRLEWNEAKGAVRDGWHHIEHKLPGDFDRDGR
jgi:uncharacterized protein YcfJ